MGNFGEHYNWRMSHLNVLIWRLRHGYYSTDVAASTGKIWRFLIWCQIRQIAKLKNYRQISPLYGSVW